MWVYVVVINGCLDCFGVVFYWCLVLLVLVWSWALFSGFCLRCPLGGCFDSSFCGVALLLCIDFGVHSIVGVSVGWFLAFDWLLVIIVFV